ncbi:MAG: peptidase S8 [Chloroflexi bacterium]|nr:peptidase S8 [Chloroflexota bacterium]
MKKRLVLTAVALITLVFSLSPFVYADEEDGAKGRSSDHILVKFAPGTEETEKEEVHRKHGCKIEESIPGIDVQVVRIRSGAKPEDEAREHGKEANVLFAEPDYVVSVVLTPNDRYFGSQWGMTKIQGPEAWDITQGSSSVKIAIVDTGIDQDHEDLAAKIVAKKNFTRSKTTDDKYGHGTHVAGIAAAITNNSKGVAGIGYNSSLMNVKVLGDSGSGYQSWVASGITWAADNGAGIINLSLGGGPYSSTMETAVNYAWSKGAVIVAAAGNDGISSPSYPAYYTNVIAVAATDSNDTKASWSNYGSWVDIAAPGVSIFSTLPNHTNRIGIKNYGSLSGTSMASPFVAGVAALVRAANPTWTNTEVRAKLEVATDPTTGFDTTVGRVNAFKAVSP